ncbi:ribose-phosphate diphosphokinase [Sandarakinorhabdus rubra]|uniref:ribose-phosphate diphosphokinase n=1 Tax=Sandarakinorhabdus rubra TaxID=2672568 RepID=UPI0013DBEBA2|nr:ribose-phosphate diphosphokinase [Sandarakinorhabdus rubra]
MTATLHAFADDAAPADRLAAALGIACAQLASHRFPDGEQRVTAAETAPTALLYRSLADPDAKLVQLLLAADALRRRGATRLVLVAPYLPYMRQDASFAPGEAVSQAVIGRLMASSFDAVLTVDPHLHRTADLARVLPGAISISAAATIAQSLQGTLPADTVLIGPDAESGPWVAAIAAPLGREFRVATKQRHDDRRVTITVPPIGQRSAFLVDDMLSSGGTLIECARQLRAEGATLAGAAVTHCLAGADDLARLAAAGITPLIACDSVPGPAATISLASALAAALRAHGLV